MQVSGAEMVVPRVNVQGEPRRETKPFPSGEPPRRANEPAPRPEAAIGPTDKATYTAIAKAGAPGARAHEGGPAMTERKHQARGLVVPGSAAGADGQAAMPSRATEATPTASGRQPGRAPYDRTLFAVSAGPTERGPIPPALLMPLLVLVAYLVATVRTRARTGVQLSSSPLAPTTPLGRLVPALLQPVRDGFLERQS